MLQDGYYQTKMKSKWMNANESIRRKIPNLLSESITEWWNDEQMRINKLKIKK